MMIYIVEDDKNIQEIESFALKNSGYEVRGFECTKDFMQELLDEQIPDLVLLDIMLPDEDGLQILKKLRLNWQRRFIVRQLLW
ncbi:MAG: response regulator [Eubacterium ramulus]